MSLLSTSKKNSKSLPPLGNKQRSYIERTLELLEKSDTQDQRLVIDGHFGDYRMKLFRRKDRNDYAKSIRSVFTSSFTESLMPKSPDHRDIREKIEQIVKQTHRPQEVVVDSARTEGERKAEPVRGNLQSTLEEEEYLMYSYLPEYQRKKWFAVVDNSSKLPPPSPKPDSPLSNKKSFSVLGKPNKKRHIFAYLEHPLYLQTIK